MYRAPKWALLVRLVQKERLKSPQKFVFLCYFFAADVRREQTAVFPPCLVETAPTGSHLKKLLAVVYTHEVVIAGRRRFPVQSGGAPSSTPGGA